MKILLIGALFFGGLHLLAQSHVSRTESKSTSFEQTYAKLQSKVQNLRQKGDKLNKETEAEIEALLVQMNHEHTKLKRELEAKNQALSQKILEGHKKIEEDWTRRLQRAFHEIKGGLDRAYKQLSKSSDPEEPETLSQ